MQRFRGVLRIARRAASGKTLSSTERRCFDVLVVGGGHAGCEAAAAAARSGAATALLTHRKDTVGEMSCNPSFGGIGKGHLIREVDAMDGVCARICDKSAITYQKLNGSHGAAVLGLRAQIDRSLYKKFMQQEIINETANLTVLEGAVSDLLLESESDDRSRVTGVLLEDGTAVMSNAVVITTGTFLGGEIFQGVNRQKAGRIGEKSSTALSATLSRLGFKMGRLRTGTPPRLLKNTIDFSKFEVKPPDEKPIPFSFLTDQFWLPPSKQLPTYLSYTNDRVAELVRKNFHENEYIRSEANGPRYCPSLEAKIMKFNNMFHKMFLEHEGLNSELIYPQGMSMSFHPEVQMEIMRAIPGLEKVQISQYGYGVEYDFVNPQQLHRSLETKLVRRLFFAGQINGTTGYEEAAAQGILAGINAAACCRGDEMMIVERSEGYLGVLVDDLTSLGTTEPYRMFTSRAEFRLHLRPDNADIRLTEKAYRMGAVSEARYKHYSEMRAKLEKARELLQSISLPLARWISLFPNVATPRRQSRVFNAYEMVHRFDVNLRDLYGAFPEVLRDCDTSEELEERIRNEGIYAAQHERLKSKMEEVKRECAVIIPDDVDYSSMANLSFECKEKFEQWRPQNLAAASRIPGVTPEALCCLLRYLKMPSQRYHNGTAFGIV